MKTARKWDFKTKTYSSVVLPDTCLTFANDMDSLVTCPGCEQSFKFGDCYTSRRYHTKMGMGYAVCAECYEQEWQEERKYKEEY